MKPNLAQDENIQKIFENYKQKGAFNYVKSKVGRPRVSKWINRSRFADRTIHFGSDSLSTLRAVVREFGDALKETR